MSWKNTESRYGSLTIVLHWLNLPLNRVIELGTQVEI